MCKGITHTRRLEQQPKEHRWENFQTTSRWDRIRARNSKKSAPVIGNQNDNNGDNKEKEFEMEKTVYMALLAIQSSEDRVPHENYDPSEAVSSSSENKMRRLHRSRTKMSECILKKRCRIKL
jgi:hypothetical protein